MGSSEEPAPHSGEVGWPAPPNKGEGLGWPGDLSSDDHGTPAQPQSRRGTRPLVAANPAP